MRLIILSFKRGAEKGPAVAIIKNIKKINGPSAIALPDRPPGYDYLLADKQAGPAPSRQGWRALRPRFAADGLDRLLPARQGLVMQVRLIGSGALPVVTGIPGLRIVPSGSTLAHCGVAE
jgi:hypothetical protein